jgi:hypothetical protein
MRTDPWPAEDPWDGLPRRFLSLATGEYDHARQYPPLRQVTEDVAALGTWLCDTGRLGEARAFPTPQAPPPNPTRRQIEQAVRPGALSADDVTVVYVNGYGLLRNGHRIVLRETDPSRASTALKTADLIEWLAESQVRHLLLVLDLCYAASVDDHLLADGITIPSTWLVLASAGAQQRARPGSFAGAVARAVEELRGRVGERTGIHRRYFTAAEFCDVLRHFVAEEERIWWAGPVPATAQHPCLPNPHFALPDHVSTAVERHDLALCRGDLAIHGEDLLTGRDRVFRELVELVRATPKEGFGVILVTGSAGSGKSALLSRLATLSDPLFANEHADLVRGLDPGLLPPLGAVTVAVSAGRKSPDAVLRQVAVGLGVRNPPSWPLPALTRCVLEQVRAIQGMTTIMIDTLDGSTDADRLAEELGQLAIKSDSRLRLVLGVRSPGGDPKPGDEQDGGGPWADQLTSQLEPARIRVDQDEWWERKDVVGYIGAILRNTPGSPYREDIERSAALAEAIADGCGRSYLLAGLAARSLADRDTVVGPEDPAFLAMIGDEIVGAMISDEIVGVFRDDLERACDGDPRRIRSAVGVLRALAFARGPGLPWAWAWPAIANAVDDVQDRYGDEDIARVLESPLAAYLVRDVADGRTVYRLIHDEIGRMLREEWQQLLPEQADGN